MPKVLCLHGIGQDGSSFYNRSIRPIANKLPGWEFYCPDGIFELSAEMNKFTYGKKNVSITKENTSEDAEIGAALTAKAILQCLEVEECSDAVRPRPRTTSSEKSQLKLHAKSTLDISVYGSHSQQELVQSLKGPKLRSWILQIPPEFPREGKWTTFDARFEYLTQYFDQHGPFDGIIGFSLGGQLATFLVKILAGLCREIEPAFHPAKSKFQSPTFAIFASAMAIDPAGNSRPREDLQQMFREWSKLEDPPTKVLFIWGTKDKFFSQDSF